MYLCVYSMFNISVLARDWTLIEKYYLNKYICMKLVDILYLGG